jgi:5-methylthioribose kinase
VSEDPLVDGLLARLVERRVVPSEAMLRVEALGGGVSADVFAVSFGDQRLVVKHALPRLRVAQEWLSSPTRVLVEADAMAFARRIRPSNVPEIIDVDDERLVIVMTAAPPGMENWKARLLEGIIDPTVGAALGAALADWHTKSSSDPAVWSRFGDRTHFFDLRVAPFLQRVAEVHQDLATKIGDVIGRMMARSICLVHGDFSPKNVLVDKGSFWVLDWEIAHIGDPTFDLAFLVSHLVCKAIHRPYDAARYHACADAFLATYFDRSGVGVDKDDLVCQVGGLLLARVDGKSPVDYFDPLERDAARTLGRRVLVEDNADLADLWEPQ